MPIGLAFKSFFALLFNSTLPDNLLQEMRLRRVELPEKREEKPTGPSKEELLRREQEAQARSIQILTLLQRDARLIDFLQEDIRSYSDDQVGAAVRNLHEGAQQVLKRYLQLEPILNSQEGEMVTISEGFDPATIKLIGNVTNKLPIKGRLLHRGIRVSKVEIPALSDNHQLVIAPAEVEIP